MLKCQEAGRGDALTEHLMGKDGITWVTLGEQLPSWS